MKLLKAIPTFLAALVGFPVGVFFLVLGLVLPEYLVFPLSFGMAGLAAMLSAGWANILLNRAGPAVRLRPGIQVTVGIAILLGAALFLAFNLRLLIVPSIILFAAGYLPILISVMVSVYVRQDEHPDLKACWRTTWISLVVAAVAFALIFGGAWALGVAGA